MTTATFESPELVDLFTTYTAGPDSIGAHLAQATARETERDPLLVVTGTDLALYPGGGAAPVIEPYRLASRGFKELAGISHLGPALATLARLRELAGEDTSKGDGGWRADAARLLYATKAARAASSAALWREQIAVRAFAGREESIAAMADYSCLLTERFLQRALDDPAYLTMAAVRRDHLAGPARHGDLPVPFNKVMIATFYLSGMDIAHRLITWLDAAGIDWERAMVIFAGQSGRPTAGNDGEFLLGENPDLPPPPRQTAVKITNKNHPPDRPPSAVRTHVLSHGNVPGLSGSCPCGRSSHQKLPVGAADLGRRLSAGQGWMRRPLADRRQKDPAGRVITTVRVSLKIVWPWSERRTGQRILRQDNPRTIAVRTHERSQTPGSRIAATAS